MQQIISETFRLRLQVQNQEAYVGSGAFTSEAAKQAVSKVLNRWNLQAAAEKI